MWLPGRVVYGRAASSRDDVRVGRPGAPTRSRSIAWRQTESSCASRSAIDATGLLGEVTRDAEPPNSHNRAGRLPRRRPRRTRRAANAARSRRGSARRARGRRHEARCSSGLAERPRYLPRRRAMLAGREGLPHSSVGFRGRHVAVRARGPRRAAASGRCPAGTSRNRARREFHVKRASIPGAGP